MTTATLISEKHLVGVTYIFRGLAYYHHGGTSYQKATGSRLRHGTWLEHIEILKPTHIVTHFLQQGHTYSNEAMPTNNATPYELMGPITFK